MTTPIHLDVQTVARAALKAYEEGRLSAQGPTPACRYRDASGRPCAIGAAIPDDVAASWDALVADGGSASVVDLVDKEAIIANGYAGLVAMQNLHDRWVRLHWSNNASEHEHYFVALCRELAGADTTEQKQRP